MAAGKRALFLDWGGTLAQTRNNRTVVDADGHPVLQPSVPETLARVRADHDACFIVSNQARVSKGEITEAEVLRRFTMKHPAMAGREQSVRLTLENPEEVRQSRIDAEVLLFYRAEAVRRWVCAVAKRTEGRDS